MPVTRRKLTRTTVTMRDVARRAKVSQSTVSRVLNESADPIPISEETRQRVLAAVEQLGYQPNVYAGSLRGQKTRMIAIMIADIANPFYHPIVRAVQDVANTHAYDVMIANSDHTLQGEEHFVESVIRRPVDGVVMIPYHLTDQNLDSLIQRTGAALAVLGQHVNHPQVDVVFGDDDKATEAVVSWLHAEKGHSRIGLIGVTDRFAVGVRRRRAYERALERAGLDIVADYQRLGDWSKESGERAMQDLMALDMPPTAVFADNDLMAIGAMEAAERAGLRVPQDVAIIGFDDIPAASWVRPRLSTVAQYPYKMGTLMAEALFQRIQGEYNGLGRRVEVPCDFVQRESA